MKCVGGEGARSLQGPGCMECWLIYGSATVGVRSQFPCLKVKCLTLQRKFQPISKAKHKQNCNKNSAFCKNFKLLTLKVCTELYPLEFQRVPWLHTCIYAPNNHQNHLLSG